MNSNLPNWLRSALFVTVVGALAACATPAPPSPPPPPPPPPPPQVAAEIVPYRPIPPGGASYVMDLPTLGPDGRRMTVNSNLDEDGTLWHFRSAWNVAALNCLDPEHEAILGGYGAFLRQNARLLTATNNAIDVRFRREHSSRNNAVKAREAYMTQVYNYFALPPARGDLCNVVLAVANDYTLTAPADPKQFAALNMPRIEAVYQEFFRQYEQYRVASSAWDVRYGSRYGASQPGYVAVYGSGGPSVGSSLVNLNAPIAANAVVDPQTGARIPVTPAADQAITTPVVQPVPDQ